MPAVVGFVGEFAACVRVEHLRNHVRWWYLCGGGDLPISFCPCNTLCIFGEVWVELAGEASPQGNVGCPSVGLINMA